MVCLEPAVRPAGGVASTGPGPGCAALRVSGSRRGAPRYATSHSVSGVLVSGPGAQSFRAPPRLSGAHRGRARRGQAAGRCAVGVVRLSGAHRGRARGGQAAGRYVLGAAQLSGAHRGRAHGGQAAGRHVWALVGRAWDSTCRSARPVRRGSPSLGAGSVRPGPAQPCWVCRFWRRRPGQSELGRARSCPV